MAMVSSVIFCLFHTYVCMLHNYVLQSVNTICLVEHVFVVFPESPHSYVRCEPLGAIGGHIVASVWHYQLFSVCILFQFNS